MEFENNIFIKDFDSIDISVIASVHFEPQNTESAHVSIPRSYQIDIFQKAINDNVIAVLDTGSGKTLIAALLIRYMANLDDYEGKKGRKSIFLVPKVPLVHQQFKYLSNFLNLKIRKCYGDMNMDRWRQHRWQFDLKNVDVIVMTPDILRFMLEKAFISMPEINLIVFDEAHHARKNHAYKQIMATHYIKTEVEHRPKIFGMTASPLFSRENTEESVKILERNLSSKAVTCTTSRFVSRPHEYVKFYETGPIYPPPALYSELMENGTNFIPMLNTTLKQSLVLCDELGTWCAERALELAMHDMTNYLKFCKNREKLVDSRIQDPEQKLQIVTKIEEYMVNNCRTGYTVPIPTTESVSPKIYTFLDMLSKFKECKNFCGIVFCSKRWTACVLSSVVKHWPGFEWLRPTVMIGHGSSNHTRSTMSSRSQGEVMKNFKAGKTNLLFATQVAEEGLDIQSCILVVRFDMFATLANYIQSRGRARHKSSFFVIMSQRDNPVEASLLACMQLEEQKMRKVLYDDSEIPIKDPSRVDHMDEYDIKDDEIFKVPSTGASISVNSSISLLYTYCNSLPTDGFSSNKPEFHDERLLVKDQEDSFHIVDQYVCKLTLPMNVPEDCRLIAGRGAETKKKARKWAAFQAIQQLFHQGELDDRLRPIGSLKGDRPAPMKKLQKKIEIYEFIYRNPVLYGSTWDNISKASLSRVSLTLDGCEKSLKIGLLTPITTNIPDIQFSFKMNNKDVSAHVQPIKGHVLMSPDRHEMLHYFHFSLFTSILRSKFTLEDKFALLVVPIKDQGMDEHSAHDSVDWELLEKSFNSSVKPVNELIASGELKEQDLLETVLYDRIHYKRRFFVLDYLEHLTPMSNQIPTGLFLGKHKTPADYYSFRLRCKTEIVATQPILAVEPIPVPLLTVSATYHDRSKTVAIPQFCTIHPIPIHIMRFEATVLPLFLYNLHHNLLAWDVIEGYNKETDISAETKKLLVSLETLRPALTAPTAELGFDYERLETFGDSFLKFYMTLHLFCLYPRRNEGWLTASRHAVERNKFLRDRAVVHSVNECILFHKMTRSDWFPPIFHTKKRTQYLPDKTVADTIEAIIGACVVDSHELGGAVAINRFLGDEYLEDVQLYAPIWNDYFVKTDDARKRLWINKNQRTVRLVEDIIGYKFKDIRYAVEALTHPSSIGPSGDGMGSCYQRLEFLGDAVLGYVITRFLFNYDHTMNPYQLSEFRSALVNNQFLAVVTCSVQLHLHLDHMSVSLAKALTEFTEVLTREMDQMLDEFPWYKPKKKRKMNALNNLNSVFQVLDSAYNENVALVLEDVQDAEHVNQVIKDLKELTECSSYDFIPNPTPMDLQDDAPLKVIEVPPLQVEMEESEPPTYLTIEEDESPIDLTEENELALVSTKEEQEEPLLDLTEGFEEPTLDLTKENEESIIDLTKEQDEEIPLELTMGLEESIIPLVSDVIKDGPLESKELQKEKESKKRKRKEPEKRKILFWEDMLSAPKTAGDIFEALVGAIYLDSGFDMESCWTMINNLIIQKWWSRFELSRSQNSGSLERNPVAQLLLDMKKVNCIDLEFIYKTDDSNDEETFECIVLIHKRNIASAIGNCRKSSKKMACQLASDYISRNHRDLKRGCKCQKFGNIHAKQEDVVVTHLEESKQETEDAVNSDQESDHDEADKKD